jgi:hypothetical protein
MGFYLLHFLAGDHATHFFRHFRAKSNGHSETKKVDADPDD